MRESNRETPREVMCACRVALTALPDFSTIVPDHSKERIIIAGTNNNCNPNSNGFDTKLFPLSEVYNRAVSSVPVSLSAVRRSYAATLNSARLV